MHALLNSVPYVLCAFMRSTVHRGVWGVVRAATKNGVELHASSTEPVPLCSVPQSWDGTMPKIRDEENDQ